jgi:molybdenum cofactor cytidylyltransferase
MRNIGAVILAAGESTRLGRPKQLLTIRGKTLVRSAVDAAKNAGCAPIIVIVGTDQNLTDAIARDLSDTNAGLLENKEWRRGIGTSVRAGMTAIARYEEVGAVLLLVCDQPFVSGDVIRRLISMKEKTNCVIVASFYSDTLGVPALFDRTCFDELLSLSDPEGAKAIILRDPIRVATVAFPKGAVDIDTADDYEALGTSN